MDLSKILTDRCTSFKTRKRVLNCYIEPIMTYRSKAWTINKAAYNTINATELWYLRKIQRIPYTEQHATNKPVTEQVPVKCSLLVNITKRQARFFGHIMRINGLEHHRGEMIHRYIGASRYFVYDTIHRYKYENIDTKRYDFAVKDTRATWRVPREVVNATPASLVQHTRHTAEQCSWISVIFTIFQRKRCNILWRTSSLGNVGT